MSFANKNKRKKLIRPKYELRSHLIHPLFGGPKYPMVRGDLADTFTEEEKREEFLKCAKSPEYFITNYCMVLHPIDGVVPFILYGFQKDKVIPGFINNRYAITRKFRQGGFSTVASGLILWMLLFQLDQSILVLSKGDREAKDFLRMLYRMYDYLPEWLQANVLRTNDHVFELETGSKVMAYTPKAGVSYSCSLLVIDEAARIQHMSQLWGDMFPTLSTGGKCWIISTCNGVAGIGQWYYEKWTDAQNGDSNFFPVDVAYTEHPEYNNEEWVEAMKKELGPILFRQEVLREFIGVEGGIFKDQLLTDMDDHITNNITPLKAVPCPLSASQDSDHKNLYIYEEPIPDMYYILSIDICQGMGNNSADEEKKSDYDYSTIQIIRMDNLEQIAEYRNNAIGPTDFAKLVAVLGKAYNNAFVVAEDGALGQRVIDHLVDVLQYTNIFASDPSKKLGLIVNKTSRQVIMLMAVDIISNQLASIKSIRLVNELRTIVTNKSSGRIDHLPGYHDDLFTAMAYGYYAREFIASQLPPGSMFKIQPIYFFDANQMAKIANNIGGDAGQYEELLVKSEEVQPALPSSKSNASYSNPQAQSAKDWGLL